MLPSDKKVWRPCLTKFCSIVLVPAWISPGFISSFFLLFTSNCSQLEGVYSAFARQPTVYHSFVILHCIVFCKNTWVRNNKKNAVCKQLKGFLTVQLGD